MIICSTHGEGEPPDSAKKFYYWLKNCIKNKQSTLEQLHFGVFAVGSSDY